VLRASEAPGGRRATLRSLDGSKGHLLSVRVTAGRLGVSTATVYKLVVEGRLPHVRVSNTIRIAPADLDAYVARQRDRP
jgi:excisionase family DNA binding protein